MCTPGSDITLDRFMRVAHLLPRQRGNVAVDDYTFANALPWMCRTGAPWRAEHGRTRLQPHEAPPQGRHPPDRPDETFLADLRLILIATYLKKHSQNPTSVNTP